MNAGLSQKSRSLLWGALVSAIIIIAVICLWTLRDSPNPRQQMDQKTDAVAEQETIEPSAETSSETNRDVLNQITQVNWTWSSGDGQVRTIRFTSDMCVLHPQFEARFHILDARHICAVRSNGTSQTKLEFDAGFNTFIGQDFDGVAEVKGARVAPIANVSLHAMDNIDTFRAYLCAVKWTWERFKQPKETIVFSKDGTMKHPFFTGTWIVTSMGKVSLTLKSGRKASMRFDPDGSGWLGTDVDGKTSTWGRVVESH